MNWRYQNVDYDTKHDESLYGFIYAVYFENDNGDVFTYYGKKKWLSETNIISLKSGIPREGNVGRVRKRKPMTEDDLANRTKTQVRNGVSSKIVEYDTMMTDNDWRTYTGSCKETEGLIPIYKEIICFARSKRELTYLETKIMFQRGALEDEKCINGNVMGRFFRDRLY